jgi:TrmH family RNA methyltransferase
VSASSLDHVCIVLWQPQDDINIGNTIRAAKNFGVTDVRLVSPAIGDPHWILVSAPKCEDIVSSLKRFDSLEDALSDCVRVIGTSARGRAGNWPVLHPTEAAEQALGEPGKVAFLFGREDHGLSNEALDHCDAVVSVPTNPDYTSLNLGQAVLLTLWECFRVSGSTVEREAPFPLARREQVERMLDSAEATLEMTGFFKSSGKEYVVRSIRSVFLRAGLDERELAIWFGVWKEIPTFLRRHS